MEKLMEHLGCAQPAPALKGQSLPGNEANLLGIDAANIFLTKLYPAFPSDLIIPSDLLLLQSTLKWD